MRLKKYKLINYSFLLLISALVLSGLGILVIRSATSGTADAGIYTKQIMGLVVGAGICIVLSLIDYHIYVKLFPLVYLICCVLLALVLVAGKVHGGARRWLVVPAIGQLQPSEFAKIALIVFWASICELMQDTISRLWSLGIILLLTGVAFGLIILEPDISTTIDCLMIFVSILYVAKISYKWILGVLAVVVPSVGGFLWYVVAHEEQLVEEHYWARRILAYFYPGKYGDLFYQQENSMMAIGSGQLVGKGLNTTTFESVKNGNFLSEAQTDFIFAVVGEELGFIGCMFVILLAALMVLLCLNIARNAKDLAGRLICVGYASLLTFQTFINICVATGMFPNTGIPLPYVSYGLSSLLSIFMGLGIVLNVGLQREKNSEDRRIPV